ncbi:MAG: NAD-dependent epimerase/dehydratase family protein [Bryobacteraceae bacterium]|nr:NAD-dependent epimerase/dehydratase family protein [Bryobacteraceae bacterium]
MANTLVTGATGFLGWHIARLLVQRGHSVRLLSRQNLPIDGLDCPIAHGDLRDRASLERAVAGCRYVFHAAADYRLWLRDESEMYASNVEGTRDLLAAAQAAGVERFVYTSTVGCIGFPEHGSGDETRPVSLEEMTGPYKKSKFLAEQVALAAARQLDVTIVNPTAPVGERDPKPTPTGKIVIDFLAGKMPAFVDTGLNLVDVHDCALGHLLALEHGRRGERYILGSENLHLREILARLARLTGRRAPDFQIPHFVAYAAGAASTGWAALTGRPPEVPLDAVRMARQKMYASSDKAKRELGYAPRPVDDALARAIAWFRAQGMAA